MITIDLKVLVFFIWLAAGAINIIDAWTNKKDVSIFAYTLCWLALILNLLKDIL